jgi:hypothetical protein
MWFRLAADAVVSVHLAFIFFVVGGGFLAWRWRRVAWFHIPAAIWGALIEFAGWICPLTPLENELRARAGGVGYQGGFIDHYLIPIIYPERLTVAMQLALGTLVVILNAFAYTVYFRRCDSRRSTYVNNS